MGVWISGISLEEGLLRVCLSPQSPAAKVSIAEIRKIWGIVGTVSGVYINPVVIFL